MASSYFLFHLNQHLTAIDAVAVEEVFALPELTLIPDAPLGIVGVLDLRGQILPVLDIQLGAVEEPRRYQISDSILVLRHEDLKVGVIVNTVQGIREISEEAIKADLAGYPSAASPEVQRMLAGVVTDSKDIFVLSDLKSWLNVSSIQQVVSVTSFLFDKIHDADDTGESSFGAMFSQDDQVVLRQRAESLRRSLDDSKPVEDSTNMVVTAIGGQLFGIDARSTREFIAVRQPVPIPCCPPHIVGNINLRGKILTVIDICRPLGLPAKPLDESLKAVVIDSDETPVAVVVDEVRDAMFSVSSPEIERAADDALTVTADYVEGVASYGGEQLYVLNLPALLSSKAVVINDVL